MTENAGSNPATNSSSDAAGTDPNKTSNTAPTNAGAPESGEKPFDEKVFDDPRLWQHPRFKSLNDQAKKAKELEKAQKDAEEQRLVEQKKFEELAQTREKERDEIKTKFTQSIQDNRIITEASKIGVVDIETILKLIDRSTISVDDNGAVTGASEALQALLTAKPFLKGKGATPIGSGTNPSADGDATAKRFKLSQLQDSQFYRDNEKDILAAYKAGTIEDDLHR